MKSATVVLILNFAMICSALGLKAQNPKTPQERLIESQIEYEKAVSAGDSGEIAELSYILGKRHIGLGNYPKAQQWLLKALAIREKRAPSEAVGKIYLRMSEIQTTQNNPKRAMGYARLATRNFEKAKDQNGLMGAYRALAGAFKSAFDRDPLGSQNPLDSAIFYHNKALKTAILIDSPIDIAITYQGLSQFWVSKGDRQRSEDYLLKALDVYSKNGLYRNVVEVSTNFGQYLIQQNRPRLALKWLMKAETLSREQKGVTPGLLVDMHHFLAMAYQQTGEWQKAFFHESEANRLNTWQFQQYRSDALHNIEAAFESEKKSVQLAEQRKQLALQQKNLEIQNRLNLITGVLLLLAILSAASLFILFRRYKSLSYQNAILVKEQNHRTKNSLQSILDLLNLQMHRLLDPEARLALEESLLRVEAVAMVHQRLYKSDHLVHVELAQYIPDLINSVLRSYQLQATHIEYQIEDIMLHIDKAITLGLIVNELSTNACKYALKGHSNPILRVNCALHAEQLLFTFSDNGPGLYPQNDKTTFGHRLIGILTEKLKASGSFINRAGCSFELSFKYHRNPPILSHS